MRLSPPLMVGYFGPDRGRGGGGAAGVGVSGGGSFESGEWGGGRGAVITHHRSRQGPSEEIGEATGGRMTRPAPDVSET